MYLFPRGCGQRKKKALHKQANLKSEAGSCRRLYPCSLQKKVHLLDISAQFFSKVPFGNLKSQRLLFSWIIMLSGKKKLSETRCEYYCDYFCSSLQQYKNNLIKHHQKRALYIYSTYKQYKTKLIQPHQKRTPTYSTYKQHKTNLVKPHQKRAPIFMLHSNNMSQVTNTCITLWSTALFNKAEN